MRLVKGDQEVEVDEGNHTLVGYYLGEGFTVDSAVSPAGGLAGFPLVFDGAQYLDATGVPEPERVGEPDGGEFAELSSGPVEHARGEETALELDSAPADEQQA